MGRGWVRCRVLGNLTQPQPNPYPFTTLVLELLGALALPEIELDSLDQG
jgi:hypothetical protein